MKEVDCLVYTSADDLRVQTKYFRITGVYPESAVLREAHEACVRLGYKTKAKILQPLLKRP
jgi:hypothetical protein